MHTVAQLIRRFVVEMETVRPLGDSHRFILKRIQREEIGSKVAAALVKQDLFAHARWRLAEHKVKPATVMHDITALTGVLKYAGSAWEDCEDISDAAIAAAKPFMLKHGLIGKSTPRERRPTPEELDKLLEFYRAQKQHYMTEIDMEAVMLWQWYSAMRIGNSCQILWEDWKREDQTILVRKMKDPKRRGKMKVVALTNQAQAFLVALETIRDPDEPRILPYVSKSCSASYTKAKHVLGIEGLRLHDSRRDRGTRLVEDDGCTPAQAICYTGHETVQVYERTYLRQDPAKIVRQVNERLSA